MVDTYRNHEKKYKQNFKTLGKIAQNICQMLSYATVLSNGGGSLKDLKFHGGWKSARVAEDYIERSMSNKMETARKILQVQPQVPDQQSNFLVSAASTGSRSNGGVSNVHSIPV